MHEKVVGGADDDGRDRKWKKCKRKKQDTDRVMRGGRAMIVATEQKLKTTLNFFF